MSVIVVDAAFKAKLLAAGGPVELRDEAGALLARATVESPSADGRDTKRLAADMGIPEAEVIRRLDWDGPTYTTEEVLAEARRRRK